MQQHSSTSLQLLLQVLYFLSGLTCDDQTFIVKSNGQRKAAEHGIAIVVCDTSPRGLNIEGEDKDWDFGTGAGFYLNATQPKYKQYRMYDYVVKELPEVLQSLPNLDTSQVSCASNLSCAPPDWCSTARVFAAHHCLGCCWPA